MNNWSGWGNHSVQPKHKVWATDAFVAEFCDPFAEDMLMVSDVQETSHRFGLCVEHLCKLMTGGKTFAPHIAEKCLGRLKKLHTAVVDSEELYRKLQGYLQWKMQYYLSKLMEIIARQIQALQADGDVVILPVLVPGCGESGTSMIVEHRDSEFVRVTVVNSSPYTEYHPRRPGEQNPTKIKQIVALTLSAVPRAKLMSEAWWSLVVLSLKPASGNDKQFYTHFCSWLTERTHEGQIADHLAEGVYATPSHSSGTIMWKSLVHSLKHVLRCCGLTAEEVKFVRHHVKQYLLVATQEDLGTVKAIKQATKVIIHAACKNTAMSIARNEALFSIETLGNARVFLENLVSSLDSIKCEDLSETPAPPMLDIDNGWDRLQQPESFPLFECMRRLESVDQFAGAAIEQARTVPTNLLRVPASVRTLEEALAALNEAVLVVTRLTMQVGVGKNHPHLVSTLLADLFVRVLPVPLSASRRQRDDVKCIWSDSTLRYGQQLHILKRVSELVEYFVRATMTLENIASIDAIRVTAMSNASAIADAVIRRAACDTPSLFSVHYSGLYHHRRRSQGVTTSGTGFAITSGKFSEQSTEMVFLLPELLTVRCAVLDYFDETRASIPNSNVIFSWDEGLDKPDTGLVKLLRQLAGSEAFIAQAMPQKLFEDHPEGVFADLFRYFPDAMYFRNIVVYYRYFLNRSFMGQQDYLSNWQVRSVRFEDNGVGGFNCYGFDGNQIQTVAHGRFFSCARASQYTAPHEVDTEEDVLHVKSLTTFGDIMGQRDSELLLSYLTVPYLRIPLVLRFFATEDRISCLKSDTIQEMLSYVLFEAGQFLSVNLSGKCPEMVPSEKPELIACPYGMLLNELMSYPSGIVEPVVRMIELASELDSGTVYNETTTKVILFLVRVVARVQSYVNYAETLQHTQLDAIRRGEKPPYRDLLCSDDTLLNVRAAYRTIQNLIFESLLPMIDVWINEVMRCAVSAQKTEEIDKATHIANSLHSHIILLLRNVREEELTDKTVALLLSSFTFLTTRYTWSTNNFPEIELYSVIQRQRRAMVAYLTQRGSEGLCSILDSVVRVTTSSTQRDGPRGNWGLVAGADCVGRFARLDDELMKRQGREKGVAELLATMELCLGLSHIPTGVVTVAEGLQDVELNLHTLSLTFKNAHLRAIPSEVANDASIIAVFAPLVGGRQKLLESMQCAVVEDSVNRQWLRLVGQDHDVQFWKTSDPRFPIPSDSQMRFYPDDLAETEQWVVELFEPIREAFFERSFWDPPIFCLIQEQKLTHANSVATLSAIDSQSGRKLKEVYVFRDYQSVHVYDVFSHGRRFYRRLVYCSDNRFCLNQLHPSTDRRPRPWPSWGRHQAGDADPDASTEQPQTCVIMRHPTHPDNLSKCTETFIPSYFLHGIIPSCLLETHMFWQDEDDNLRGYPIPPIELEKARNNGDMATVNALKDDHILWIHWRETQFDPLGVRNTCAQVYRFARAKEAPKSSEEAVMRSTKQAILTDEVDGELEMTRAHSADDNMRNAELEAGMFRQSSVVPTLTNKNDAATIEDNNLMLLNLMYARAGTPLHSLAKVFARIELLSHVLVWTTKTDYNSADGDPFTIDLIQLPRLKLSFTARLNPDGQTYSIYSLDHSQLCITNQRPALVNTLLQGVPHSLLLADSNHSISILVPSLNFVRPVITSATFSTELVLHRGDEAWYKKLDTRYYLYPVHVSLSFLFTPTLASALYLMLLRFCNRNYQEVFRLAGSIGTDMEFTQEEAQIFGKLNFVLDCHPNAHACRAKISLLVADSPVALAWYVPDEVSQFITKLNHVSVNCRLHVSEERRLLYVACMLERKVEVIRAFVKKFPDAFTLVMNRLADRLLVVSGLQAKECKKFYAELSNDLREKLDVRVSQEDMNRLLLIFNQHCKEPMSPYFKCVLTNRQQIIEAECSSTDSVPTPLQLSVPPLGEDLKWLFYADFNPVSVKPPGSVTQQRNSEGRAVSTSGLYDYYYCGASVRTGKTCKCRSCNEVCGPSNGCPCPSCETFNRETGVNIRLLPDTLDAQRSQRSLSFYEAFLWATEVLNKFAQWRPDPQNRFLEKTPASSLREANNAFLRYYELLTGTIKMKICTGDSGRDFAQLLFHYSREARVPAAALGHLGQFLVQSSPEVVSKLVKYNRTSKQKPEQRATNIYNSLLSVAGQYKVDRSEILAKMPTALVPSTFEVLVKPRPSTRTVAVPLHQTTILPVPKDTDCRTLTLGIPDHKHLRVTEHEVQHLLVTRQLLHELSTKPLQLAVDDGVVGMMNRADQNLPLISEALPFDLSKHEHASKTVAKEMLQRLTNDMADFASKENSVCVPKILRLATLTQIRDTIATGKTTQALRDARAMLSTLQDKLKALRDRDQQFLAYAMPAILRTANYIETNSNHRDNQLLLLRRFADKECSFTLDYLIASICSTTFFEEWANLNPCMSRETCEALQNEIIVTVLHASRVGHANRACEMTKDLLALLEKADRIPEHLDEVGQASFREALVASTLQKADSLAAQLNANRCYLNPDSLEFDPRFLLFEFTWNLVLRDRQRELVMEMFQAVETGTSLVKQMIMGAGKTTVVGPLLGMMVANGSNLVVQVVPPALLDFTRAVLRTTFSSVLQKQIFTFICDRSSEVDSELLSKFLHAKTSRGIVVTTPSSIKSIFLKYVERLDKIADPDRANRTVNDEKEAKDLLNVISMLRKSVLIMDEVDMLLHPLKSELNFPIGAKHNIDFTPTRWKLPIHIIDAVFYIHTHRVTTAMKDSPHTHDILQRFKAKVREGIKANALQEMPHVTLLNTEFYDKELKPVLAEWTAIFIKAQHFVGLDDEETVRYIQRRPTLKENPELVEKISKLEEDHVKMLNLAFEWLNCFLPHVLQKIDRVSFGIMNAEDIRRAREDHPHMPQSRYVTAIPFIGKDLPSQSSEFAHPDVVIGLTILAYRYEGIRQMDFVAIMRELHASVEKEVGRFSHRRTNIMFSKWIGASGGRLITTYNYDARKKQRQDAIARGDEIGMQPSESLLFDEDGNIREDRIVEVLPLKLMKQANQSEIDKLFKLFRRTAEVIHWYLCEAIFPNYMRHQNAKLSASGQELGGEMMFERRIGFSGTPSDLLPIELGHCAYERGTDGELIHTLTNPAVMSYQVVDNGWTVRGLLDLVANASPPFHALIDTGALVTGLSNQQVAQYLLKNGLPQMEGVVFLDEYDRKMILVRATGRVLKLAECGIPKVKRFAFYDQVHTTGMDIEHTPNAVAIQTLGKDMTFRDLSQGAYRMRGIGIGQTVHLLIIPEVYDLINRSLRCVRQKSADVSERDDLLPISKRPAAKVLTDITAWLLVNSIRSEHTQHNQLCLQSCANVWRKSAFKILSERVSEFKVDQPASEEAMRALQVFREAVHFNIANGVPQPRLFSECVKQYVEQGAHLVASDEGRSIIQAIVDQTVREDEIENPVIDVQMVQEQEEEKETEQEQEKEQEIEIEKFVDLAYSRDEETFTTWRLETLRDGPARCPQFYKLSDFHLYKRRPLSFPDSIFLSKNFFNKKWSGHRRIKNVIVTLEWTPSTKELRLRDKPDSDYNSIEASMGLSALERTLSLVGAHQQGFNEVLVQDLFATALNTAKAADTPSDEWSSVVASLFGAESEGKNLQPEAFYNLLASNTLRSEESGRFIVCVSLAEAETLRRVIHLRAQSPSLLTGADTAIGLNIVPSNFATLDKSVGYKAPLSTFMHQRSFQCLRFFDCDLHYTEPEFGMLLRSIHKNPEKMRQAFFQQVISCRRRARQRWERTPISLLFVMRDAFSLFHQRSIGLCIRKHIESKELSLGDAFMAFNSSHSGILSPDELWGASQWCGLNLTADEIIDFIDVADSSHEGCIQYPDFLSALTGNREYDEDAGATNTNGPNTEEAQGKKLPTIQPHGAELLKATRGARLRKQRELEAEANREMESENQRVMDEIESEQISEELQAVQDAGNPFLSGKSLTFSFHTEVGAPPKVLVPFGGKVIHGAPDERMTEISGAPKRCCYMEGPSGLRLPLRLLKRLVKSSVTTNSSGVQTNEYSLSSFTISTEFALPISDKNSAAAASWGQPQQLGLLAELASVNQPLTLASWQLPMYRFTGFNAFNMPPFEMEVFGAQAIRAVQTEAEAKVAVKAKAKAVRQDQQNPGLFAANMLASAGAVDNNNYTSPLHVFAEPKPSATSEEAVGAINPQAFVVVDGEKTNNSIEGVTYEWMHIVAPVVGWVVREKNGARLWDRLATTVKIHPKGKMVVEQQPVPANATELTGKFEEPVIADDEEDSAEAKKKKKQQLQDQEDLQAAFGTGGELNADVSELLEALRKAKRLRSGDKVVRNSECWERGDEDGGVGKVGKVLRVENDTVHVQWSGGNKGQYQWGQQGRFELIKVADADSDDEGEEREVLNDDRWLVELRKGGQKCNHCNAAKLDPGNWFRCNHCDAFHLCKKCFRSGQHAEHDFTDMGALNQSQQNDIGPGATVRIKLIVTNPKYGWESSFAGATGVVLDVDVEENSVTVEMDHDKSEFRADMNEIEMVKDDKAGVDDCGIKRFGFLLATVGDFATATTVNVSETAVNAYHTTLDNLTKKYPFLSCSIMAAKAVNTPKFAVNDHCIYNYCESGTWYPVMIRSVDIENRQYSTYSDHTGHCTNVQERLLKPLKIKIGDTVRIKRNVNQASTFYVPNFNDLKRLVGPVVMVNPYSGETLGYQIQFDGQTHQLASQDIELVGNGKWTMHKFVDPSSIPVADDTQEAVTSAPLPMSSNVLVERAFGEGQQHITIFIRDDLYELDLATLDVKRAGKRFGRLTRDPPEAFAKGEDKVELDDGNAHVVSLVVNEGDVVALCDGKPCDIQYAGIFLSIKDQAERDRMVKLAMRIPYDQTPLNILVSTFVSPESLFGQSVSKKHSVARELNWLRLDWATPSPAAWQAATTPSTDEPSGPPPSSELDVDNEMCTVDGVSAWHAAIAKSTVWNCRECRRENARWAEACSECKVPRIEKRTKSRDVDAKFRCAMPKSREAATVRAKLQGKLKSQVQKELDILEEAATQQQKAKGKPGPGKKNTGV